MHVFSAFVTLTLSGQRRRGDSDAYLEMLGVTDLLPRQFFEPKKGLPDECLCFQGNVGRTNIPHLLV